MDLTNSELVELRKELYIEVKKISRDWEPEAKDFEYIKNKFLSHIAYKIWEKHGTPKNQDIDIWIEAVNVWNFLRYMW